ncbi:Ribosomal protein S18 acetylase RimI [Amycolatopsis lurida]|uniref:Acetyltransferase n=1 Tax=Amycolatopsis lurida NRRL 2430 TaxID=1460371 RepID=A0A2P2FQJ5_AMYLU|nr:GNAT family N-acetyltransferase [Amycolatopsis lurida]KFU79004.1 acetyltransferase [Amycolatopsis lurida NRRL 2430]SED75243.1 Ribosomal protein S18 acetylase RimI [Amycolatopsis lurida]
MVLVRRLIPADLDVFREIRLRALTDTPENYGSIAAAERAQSDEEWLAKLTGDVWFAAFDDGSAVGLVAGRARDDGWILYSMWVAPEARRQGLGTKLMGEVRSAAEDDGAREVWLHVAEDNDHARRLYLRLGFIATGELEPMPNDVTRRRERLYLPVAR